jgi:hypothetical protein
MVTAFLMSLINNYIVQQVSTTNELIEQIQQATVQDASLQTETNNQLAILNERMVALDGQLRLVEQSVLDQTILIDGYEASAYQQESNILNELTILQNNNQNQLSSILTQLQQPADEIDFQPLNSELDQIESEIQELIVVISDQGQQNQLDDEADELAEAERDEGRDEILERIEGNTARTATAAEGINDFLNEDFDLPESETDYDTIGSGIFSGITQAPIVQAITDFNITVGSGECPKPTITAFGDTFLLDGHCTLYSQIAGILSAAMFVFWTITAFRIFVSV